MKAKHLIFAVGAAALVALGVNDLANKDANALERLSARAGLQVDCKIEKIDGDRWGACRYKNGAPASAWLDRDDEWVAGNGGAIKVMDRLAYVQDLQNLPSAKRDLVKPPVMPAAVFE